MIYNIILSIRDKHTFEEFALVIKDITDTDRSVSYLDIHLEN